MHNKETLPFFLQSFDKKIIFISKNHTLLENLHHNLSFLECDCTLLSPKISFHINHKSLDNEQFLKNYMNLFENQPQITLLHSSLLSMPMPEPDSYSHKTFKINEEVPLEIFVKTFLDFGYTRTTTVYNNSEFAIRGYIIDFASFEKFYRIEFYGNKIDSIKIFDPSTQKSIENIDAVTIYPNSFLIPSLCNFEKFPIRYQIATQSTNEELFFIIKHHPESCDINKYVKLLLDRTINILDILSGEIILHNSTVENITFSKEIEFFENQHQIQNNIFYFTQKEVENILKKYSLNVL